MVLHCAGLVHTKATLRCSYFNTSGRPTNLDGGRDEEILLLETQLFALICAVIWVQHTAQCLGTLLGKDSLQVTALLRAYSSAELLAVHSLAGLLHALDCIFSLQNSLLHECKNDAMPL